MELYEQAKDTASYEKLSNFPQSLAMDSTVSDPKAMVDPDYEKEKHEEMDTKPSADDAMSDKFNEDGEEKPQSLAATENKDENDMNVEDKEAQNDNSKESDDSDPDGSLFSQSISMNQASEGDEDMDETATAQDDEAEN
jgi:hypothetical protein